MRKSCARAVELGVPSVAFTEHAELTGWITTPDELADLPAHARGWLHDGRLTPPALDVAGYLAGVARCRAQFPQLRVLSGVELSEPHWHPEETAALLAAGRFDRVLGSVHALGGPDGARIVDREMVDRPPADVVRAYLAEALRLAESDAPFAVLAHIDYPVRHWPAGSGRFRPAAFEAEFRAVLAALAASGRALEINTRVPLAPELVAWWADTGGDAVSFASDAHRPAAVAHGFAEAATVARSCGFQPADDPTELWPRRRPPR